MRADEIRSPDLARWRPGRGDAATFIFVAVATCASALLLSLATWAAAAQNPNCTLPGSVGYQNCVNDTNPTFGSSTKALHCGRTYRHQIVKTGASWGPWQWTNCGVQNYVPKLSGWNWSGTVTHQAREWAGGTMAVEAAIS
jgi:hypothetical protein